MAKLSPAVADAMAQGFNAPGPQNPHIWSSPVWEAWEFGHFARQTGRSIDGIEKGRGGTYRTPYGSIYRASYGGKAGGGTFGFERTA